MHTLYDQILLIQWMVSSMKLRINIKSLSRKIVEYYFDLQHRYNSTPWLYVPNFFYSIVNWIQFNWYALWCIQYAKTNDFVFSLVTYVIYKCPTFCVKWHSRYCSYLNFYVRCIGMQLCTFQRPCEVHLQARISLSVTSTYASTIAQSV